MIDFGEVKQNTQHKWLSIYNHFGIDIDETGRHTKCPVCGTKKNHFRVDNKNGMGEWICTCGSGDGISLLMNVMSMTFPEIMKELDKIVGNFKENKIPEEKKISPEVFKKLFSQSEKISLNCQAYGYLKNRGLSALPEDIWFCEKCYEPETRKERPAMLAVFRLPSGKAITAHRTYLNGIDKLDIEKPKKVMPGLEKMNGGAVRLFQQQKTLGIAEGIETAIAAYEDLNIPVWAALNTANLESFVPPTDTEHLVVISDNDKNFAGQKSAFILANKQSLKGLKVSVYVPEMPGHDWLDQYINQKNRG